MNIQIDVPDKVNQDIYKQVMKRLPTDILENIVQKKGKIIYIDGYWWYIDMNLPKRKSK